MIDETAGVGERSGAPEQNAGQTETVARVAFCQQCGRELTNVTVRRAGDAVFCEPCLVARLSGAEAGAATGTGPTGAGGAWTPVGATGAGPSTGSGTGAGYVPAGAPVTPLVPGEPSPGLAALLGLIPGVGAMYNGQFAKGVAHLVIFAILVSLADNVNGVFSLLVTGWVFYQAFEAYHTAKARREGLPLPNPFGLNDIGDRMGFGRNWPGSASRPVTTAASGASAAATPGGAAGATPHWTPNWAGYVPPTGFGATAPPPPAAATETMNTQPPPSSTGAWTAPPYATAYTGEPWQTPGSVPGGPPYVAPAPLPGRHFPAGAAWLIGLGVLFLLSNLDPAWRLRGHWLVPILLAALAASLMYRRVESLHAVARLSNEYGLGPDGGRRLVCQVRMPVVLLVLAVLFALQAAGVLTLGQTWPVLFIAYGGLLLLERAMGRGSWPTPPVYPATSVTGVAGAAARASWTADESATRKDGQ